MEIIGIGLDLVDCEKLSKKNTEEIAKRILAKEELAIYDNITNKQAKLLFLAGRFAGKEAIFKAFKKGDGTANYKDFIILNDESGAPYVESKFLDGFKLHITITHIEKVAASSCILLKV